MRLMALYPSKVAMEKAEENLPEQDWQAPETWFRIRKCCEKKLRALFPFLPHGEENNGFASWMEIQSKF